jgi:hypothetical protein
MSDIFTYLVSKYVYSSYTIAQNDTQYEGDVTKSAWSLGIALKHTSEYNFDYCRLIWPKDR